ncbi:uncharacterized protein LOC135469362 [Liolophura sinensis]|uniref:uncharacterized protein LOC135469362 n=1 Tax=Liolophura sinensis TaxID=3198878 RepID=UPI0031581C5B
MHRALWAILVLSSVVSHPLEEKARLHSEKETVLLAERIVELYNSDIETKVELSEVLSLHRVGQGEGDHAVKHILQADVVPRGCDNCAAIRCHFIAGIGGSSLISCVCGRPGGFKPVPSDDSGVLGAARYAVEDLNRRSNCVYQYKLVTVQQAQLKIENGVDYLLNITTCMYRPSDMTTKDDPCQKIHPEIIQHCDVEVLVHPWETQEAVMTAFKCTGCA